MKRIIITFCISLLFLSHSKAQQFRVGLLAGVNITDVDGMDPVDFDNDFHKFGFTIGGYVNVHIAEKTMLQMEIAYSQKGSSFPPDTSLANFNNNNYYLLQLNYLNVDLALRHNIHVNMGKNPTDRFSIECGVSTGYLFHYFYSAQSIVYSLPLRTLDISPFVGFSYNFSDNFCIDLRYYNSATSIFDPNGVTNTQFLYYGSWNRGHNLNFQITFKYTFGSGQPSTPGSTASPASN